MGSVMAPLVGRKIKRTEYIVSFCLFGGEPPWTIATQKLAQCVYKTNPRHTVEIDETRYLKLLITVMNTLNSLWALHGALVVVVVYDLDLLQPTDHFEKFFGILETYIRSATWAPKIFGVYTAATKENMEKIPPDINNFFQKSASRTWEIQENLATLTPLAESFLTKKNR